MISFPPFQVLEQPCDEAAEWISSQLTSSGLQVTNTFNLQIAQFTNDECPCPIHGSDLCDCRVRVMLVYKAGSRPVTLLMHGHDGRTWLSLVSTPQLPMDGRMEMQIRKILSPLLAAVQSA